MTQTTDASPDPILAIAERQLAILAELSALGMEAARAFTTSAVASAQTAEVILKEDWFVPEVGRARACGAKEAAESFQKVSRSVRLTLVLEMNVAEIARDVRAGVVTYIGGIAHRKSPGETPAVEGGCADKRGSSSDERDTDLRSRDANTERLYEYERPDILPQETFRETVERICDDLGTAIDWASGTIAVPDIEKNSAQRTTAAPPPDRPDPAKQDMALSP